MLAKSKLDSTEALVSQALTTWKQVLKNLMQLLQRNKNLRGRKKMRRMSTKNKKI